MLATLCACGHGGPYLPRAKEYLWKFRTLGGFYATILCIIVWCLTQHNCLVSYTAPVFPVSLVSETNTAIRKRPSMFTSTPVTAPHKGKIQAGSKLSVSEGSTKETPELVGYSKVSGLHLRKKEVLFSSSSLPSATSLLWVTEFPPRTLWYQCLMSSPAGTSAYGAAVLKGRKTRKGFAHNSAHTGSRVEEMSPALQARWGLSFAWTSGRVRSMPANWTGSLEMRKGKF